MSSYGIRVSQAGIPINKAADYQMVMDDRWPIIEFSFMGIVDLKNIVVPAPGSNVYITVFEHNLGFVPGFRFKGISYSGMSTNNQALEDLAVADERYVYLNITKTNGVALNVNVKFFLAVMDRDISATYQSEIATPSAGQTSNPSAYGLKILADSNIGKMSDMEKRRFSFNTNAKSMVVQAHGIQAAETSGSFIGYLLITHRLGYPPTYNVAKRFTAGGTGGPSGKLVHGALNGGAGIGFSDGITLRLRGGQSSLTGNYVYIILKDPVDTAK